MRLWAKVAYMSTSLTPQSSRRAGYVIHVMTASGAVAGLLALQAIFDNNWRAALLWLIACQVLDGLDGPIARRFDVTIHAPIIDGHVLDLVVDYVTCVVVPVALLGRLKLLPTHYETLVAGTIFLTSALWFARTDQETEDHWFNGFPAVWNLVVPTLLIFGSSSKVVMIVCLLLCASQLTRFKIPHLVRVATLRKITLPLTIIYLIDLSILSWQYSDITGSHPSVLEKYILLGFPLYIFGFSIWRTWFKKSS
jgi:phosphatidylcholine synthase